jgi:hypothetical protein
VPRTKQLGPADLERLFVALLSRLMVRLNGDPDHDDELVRNFCCKLDLPYRDIRELTYVHPPSGGLN